MTEAEWIEYLYKFAECQDGSFGDFSIEPKDVYAKISETLSAARLDQAEKDAKLAERIPLEGQHHSSGQYSGAGLDGLIKSIHSEIAAKIRESVQ